MAQFACPNCQRLLQFETRVCRGCGQIVGLDPQVGAFCWRELESGAWACARGRKRPVVLCGNSRYGACNWLVTDEHPSRLCLSCRYNAIIPDLSAPGVLKRWRRVEDAKRRAISGVLRLGMDLDGVPPLAFHLLYDPVAEAGGPPQHPTGYFNGVITLNLVEADDSARERIRAEMGEPYRTLVGHFRHELGHHFWWKLIAGTVHQDAFRRLFGDETTDYAAAAQAYYAQGGRDDWAELHVSRYATMHPWEDFAETFAHFLHMVDTLATIREFDLTLAMSDATDRPVAVRTDPYRADTATLARTWPSYAFALNAVNRSMGQPDLYPFGLNPIVVLKLDFINRLIADAAGRAPMGSGEAEGLAAMIAVLASPADLAPG